MTHTEGAVLTVKKRRDGRLRATVCNLPLSGVLDITIHDSGRGPSSVTLTFSPAHILLDDECFDFSGGECDEKAKDK